MKGYIYVITNDINGNQYVGKTTETLEERFKQHIKDSKKRRCEKRPIYDAMNKYGVEHFSIKELEQCDLENLATQEQYWVDKLDTYYNGYNATRGGDGKILYDYIVIVEDYQDGYLVKEICAKYGCDKSVIRRALNCAGIENGQENRHKRDRHHIAQYDKNNNFIQEFESQVKAAEYLIKQGSKGKITSISTNIGRVLKGQRKTAEGYIWKLVDE